MSTQADEDYVLNTDDCIHAQAWQTYQSYKQHTSYEDLIQEGYVWLLEHPKEVQEYKDHGKPKLAYWWLSRDLWKAMDRYARGERAQALGYEPDDEAFYGKGVLEALLPHVLTDNPIQPQGESSEIRSSKDPAEGGTFLAMYLDVQHAWNKAKLTARERDTIRLVYGEQWTQKEVADEQGIGQPTVSKAVRRAFDKMIAEIGGKYPADDDEGTTRIKQ